MNQKTFRSVPHPVGQNMCIETLFQDMVGTLVCSHRETPARYHSQPRLWQLG